MSISGTLVDGNRIATLIEFASDATPRELLFATTRGITELLGERGSCILLDGAPHVALAPHAPTLVDWPVDLARYPEVAAAIQSREVVTIEDAQHDARLAPVRGLLPAELRSVTTIPLVVGDHCLGVFLVQSRRAWHSTPEARATAALMARLTALVLFRRDVRPAALAAPATPLIDSPSARVALPGRILLIEDDPEQASILGEMLREEGYSVESAEDGVQGLRRAETFRPDVVLLDVNLPVMDGFETAERLRQSRATQNVPILFLSGAGDLSMRVRAVRMDDVDFLPKPFSFDELLARMQRALSQAATRTQLRADAERDELTGLGNLRVLRARLTAERARFERYGPALSVVVIDVDKLKRINDRHGHIAGSLALRSVADALNRQTRETDLAVRYGGDEFVVLLPHTGADEALAFAERARAQIASLDPGGIRVTVSVGVASLSRRASRESNEELIHRADSAAYRAKRQGGNQVCAADTRTTADDVPSATRRQSVFEGDAPAAVDFKRSAE
jgi:diguanylate cyclase (GGDEF)-like protein